MDGGTRRQFGFRKGEGRGEMGIGKKEEEDRKEEEGGVNSLPLRSFGFLVPVKYLPVDSLIAPKHENRGLKK